MMPAINFITFISQLKLSGLCDVSVSSKNPLLDLKPRKKGHHDGDALKNQKKVDHNSVSIL